MSAPRRAAVYNRFWRSQGGGERHSGMVAQVLSQSGLAVELLGHEEIDVPALAKHLGLNLDDVTLRVLPDVDEGTLAQYTAQYDLFVNGSYMSRLPSQARHSAYLCYFPTPAGHDLDPRRRAIARALRPLVTYDLPLHFSWGTGWFPPEGGRRRSWQWTSGDAELIWNPGPDCTVTFEVGRPGLGETDVEVTVGGRSLLSTRATVEFARYEVALPASSEPRSMHFTSTTDRPAGTDSRDLGVAVSRLRMAGQGLGVRAQITNRMPWLRTAVEHQDYLDSYDVILANSRYTRGWIQRYWGRNAEVLYPPIQVDSFRPRTERTASIVTAGRFFAPKLGHSKRQLEQVELFAKMQRAGLLEGWTLHVIGGCEDSQRPYVDRVRAAGFGLPVELHVNAPRNELEDLMSAATIIWSATGWGEDENKAPWASEHFGMTTVEAMAAGCVPIVIDRAGQREIVRDGIDGFRWRDLDELAARTVQVVIHPELAARMSASSRERAQQYSDQAFAARLGELIAGYDLA